MQATPCANTQYLNAYLREQDLAESRQNWIELEAAMKLQALKPYTYGDLDEAMSETMALPTPGRDDKHAEHRAAIHAAFAGTDDCALGKALRNAVDAYWLTYCTNQATDEYDDGAAEADYGRY